MVYYIIYNLPLLDDTILYTMSNICLLYILCILYIIHFILLVSI